jgi:hypothetical protein
MLTRKLLAMTLLICAAGAVSAAMRAVEQGLELAATDVTLPVTSDATLNVRRCRECPLLALRVSADTAWVLAGPARVAVPRDEFRRIARGNAEALIYVFYSPDSLRVTRMVLDAPDTATVGRGAAPRGAGR